MIFLRVIVVGSFCCLIAGCSGNGDERPTAPVQVIVNYKGAPVEDAIVQFISVNDPKPAVGTTDKSGKCSLTTYRANDGAVIGSNMVTITKNAIDKTNVRPVKPEDQDLVGVMPVPTLKNLIPYKYSAPGTSGLKEEVKKGKNEYKFDLVDK